MKKKLFCNTLGAALAMGLALNLASGIKTEVLAQTKATSTVTVAPAPLGQHTNSFHASADDLRALGYVEREFLISGEATGAATANDPASNGHFTTRLLVRRPADMTRFKGTVVVEWQNVSGGFDFEVGWPMFRNLLVREGYAWVGVSAQPVSVKQLKGWDPQRYAKLEHPALMAAPQPSASGGVGPAGLAFGAETWSYDIFTRVSEALRKPDASGLLGGARPQYLIAYGLSQSAARLTSYINRLKADERPYNGYFIHVGPGVLRDDLNVPVFGVNSEAEMPRYFTIRRPDSKFYRYWEIAGAGHVPVTARKTLYRQFLRDDPANTIEFLQCEDAPAVPSIELASSAALHHLNIWIKTGQEPPTAPLASLTPGEGPNAPPTMVRDKWGNLVGGVRLPHVEVPIGRHVGVGSPASCHNVPGFDPFDRATLATLYPSHKDYVAAVTHAATVAAKAGYLLPEDAATIVEDAFYSDIGVK